MVEGDAVRYGWSGAVPSVLDEPPSDPISVVVLRGGGPDAADDAALERTLSGLGATVTDDPGIVVVDGSSGPAPARSEARGRRAHDVVRLAAGLGPGSELEAGLRRTLGAVVVVLRAGTVPGVGLIERLASTLADPSVAILGARGFTSSDLIRLEPAHAGDVVSVDVGCCAFRRADAAARLPLDERFRTRRYFDAWWSLVLRDAGLDRAPRRAVVLGDLPVELPVDEPPADRDRVIRRDAYRFLDTFRGRADLTVSPATLAGWSTDSASR